MAMPPFDAASVETRLGAKRHSYQQAVELIQRKRSDLVARAALQIPPTEQAQTMGKLLLYEVLETVTDGAAEASSFGFFDCEDASPWDTWFWYSQTTIFSWVPNILVQAAQAGIDANPVDCIHWADWSKLPTLL